ncbi:hypothetical protein M422DRAFT_46027 [Sphaerobolus stellatus SS14]|uniref:Uncharacterized protein n=1 Tax=Sphaerobolus stellatus (strain SS14) TaxID=990650 RepID=A0A0C9W414_SPHS4|nr:hypothetical protein M422DRAFT_46027 [Sphaerobolus stellatus SS14]
MSNQVIPTGVFDTSGNEKDSIVVTGWVLDQVLDAGKVETAYCKLVQRWPILSSRLRTRGKKWVYEIPSKFDASTPQYIFKKVVIPGPIEKTYRYPKASSSISCTVKHDPNDLFSQDGPRSVGAYMKSNIPVAQLQVTLFDDATLVGLTTPHVLCDGHGNKEITNAVTRILRGEDVEDLPSADPFTPFVIPDDKKDEPIKTPPFWKVFSTWDIVTFMAYLAADFIKTRDISNRDIFFPKEEVERIKQQAMDDLKKEKGDDPEAWVSSSDALIAFCLKRVHPRSSSTTPLNVLYSANLRRYLKHPAPLPRPFLHNAAMTVVTPTLPLSAIHTLSLGALAYHPFPVRNIMGLVADDPSGGIWMGGFFSDKKVWEREDGFKEFIV